MILNEFRYAPEIEAFLNTFWTFSEQPYPLPKPTPSPLLFHNAIQYAEANYNDENDNQ